MEPLLLPCAYWLDQVCMYGNESDRLDESNRSLIKVILLPHFPFEYTSYVAI